MLDAHGDEVGGHCRPARLRAEGHGEELPRLAAVGTLKRYREESVVGTQRVAVGGDPQVAVRVECQIVRAGDRADLRFVEPAEVGVGRRGIAADQQQVPAERGAGVVVGDLENLPVLVVITGVGRIGAGLARRAPLIVIGQRDIEFAGLRVGFEILRAVHLGGPGLVGGHPGKDRHLSCGHPVDQGLRRPRLGTQQRNPGARTGEPSRRREPARAVDLIGGDVAGQLRDVQRPLVEDRHVGRHRRRVAARGNLPAGDEFVEVVKTLVVAAVGHHGAVPGDPDVGGFVFEAPQRGVLNRGGVGIPGVQFGHPAEPVDLVGRLGRVEPRVEGFPSAFTRLEFDAVALPPVGVGRCRRLGAVRRAEVVVEVLLGGKHGSPGGHTTGAVVERTDDGSAGGVRRSPDEDAAGGRPGEGEWAVGGDAPVVRAHDRPEALSGAFHLDDRNTLRRNRCLELVAGGILLVVAGVHEPLGGVLVIDDEQEAVG